MKPVGVLLVDDSQTVRAVLRRILGAEHGIEVVGEATDGVEAVEQTLRLRPDVIIMDLDLPKLDGYDATKRIMARRPTPVVVVTSKVRREQMQPAFRAMRAGAVAVFPKPTVPQEWEELTRVLPETIRELGHRAPKPAPAARKFPQEDPRGQRVRQVAIGASTGGPEAVLRVLRELGTGFPAAVVVVQHIAAGFEEGFADWLAHELNLDVRVASQGEELCPGTVRIGPAGYHLRLGDHATLELDRETPPLRGHRPAVDELFRSLAQGSPREVAAVLLTGMGSDGAEGMLALRKAGAFTVAQDEASSVVYGMPRSAVANGAVDLTLPPEEIGRLLNRMLRESRS